MNTLAIDTCDRRGSVALRSDGLCVSVQVHADENYSSWLLPAAERSLATAHKNFADLDLLAVATGPGSFTALRVGLCAVKAWAEVYGLKIVGVSRLEALARGVLGDGWIAASYDAHRGQVFAGIYRRRSGQLQREGDDLVIAPADFLALVRERTDGAAVNWASLDPHLLGEPPRSNNAQSNPSKSWSGNPQVADSVGEIAEEKAARGEFTDVLKLDANYVRRSDAEIFWKGPAYRG